MKKVSVIVVLSLFVMMACSKKINPATTTTNNTNPAPKTEEPAAVKPEVVTTPEAKPLMPGSPLVAQGEIVFKAKCGKCHELKNPGDFTVNNWEGILKDMMPKAKLDFSEQEQVKAYVNANARK